MIKVFRFYSQILWNKTKFWMILSAFVAVLEGLIPILTLWVTKETVNEVALIINNPKHEFNYFTSLLIFQFFLLFFNSALKNWHIYVTEKAKVNLDFQLKEFIFTKITSVPYFYFDIADFYNHHNRIKNNPAQYFVSLYDKILSVITAFITLGSMVIFLYNIHWVLTLLSFVSAIPVLLIQSYFGNQNFFLLLQQTPKAREISYIEYIFNNRDSAKEIRSGKTTDFLKRKWEKSYLENAGQAIRLFKKQQFGNMSIDAISAILFSIAAFIIVKLVKLRSLKIGDFVAIGQAITNTQQALNTLSMNVAKVYEDYLYINDYYLFIHFTDNEHLNPVSENNTLDDHFPVSFHNVSFSYLNSTKEAIRNVSFEIKPGETVAIVGKNGSGKSTLIKCLTGLYQPTQGEIYYDTINYRDISPNILQTKIATLHQSFVKYPFTLSENITCGEEGVELTHPLFKRVGINDFASKLTDGYDTYLGKFLYDGDDLSGGQWQKVALARNLVKKEAEIFIFDEPTSALDSISELELFRNIKDLTYGKTVIYISHQMAATKNADKIIVLKNGMIEEIGTHEELLLNEGEYYNLYTGQAQWFHSQNEVMQS